MTRKAEQKRSIRIPDWAMSVLAGVGRVLDDRTPPIGATLGRFQRARLSQYLPYRYWDEDHELFLQDRSIGIVLEITPLIGGDSLVASPGATAVTFNRQGFAMAIARDTTFVVRDSGGSNARDTCLLLTRMGSTTSEHSGTGACP